MKLQSYSIVLVALVLPALVNGFPDQSCRDPLSQICSGNDESGFILDELNEIYRKLRNSRTTAEWDYRTNITDANQEEMLAVSSEAAIESKQLALRVKNLGYPDNLQDEVHRREAIELSDLGHAVLRESDYKELTMAITNMEKNYATAAACSFTDRTNCTLTLEPFIQERLSNSRDPEELEHYWREWHDKAGTPAKEDFKKYVELANKGARLNNFTSYAEYWIHFYEDENFEENLDAAFARILPFYRQLHAYVRYRLKEVYGESVVPPNGNIPMHLLGNMWAQDWANIIDLTIPFPEKPFIDITPEMRRQGYTVQKIFEMGDDFFTSLNLTKLPESFWNLSMLERPEDRDVVCHASAWDFYQNSDVRIAMCTEIDSHYFYVVHHELGHIQYYLQYQNQPASLRGAPNPGFHEAVGDMIALSVKSAKHLNSVGLLDKPVLDEQSRINELFNMALEKIIFLPFSYTLDKYRLAIFRGEIDPAKWNCAFWQMRSEYSGVEPPVVRTDNDFDPPAKYHVSADVEYLRYFNSFIFQFQFHKALCTMAGQFEANNPELPLDNCDIYKSKKAGNAFREFLAAGNTKHWKVLLNDLTGSSVLDPRDLLEFFKPLNDWLVAENRRLNIPIGWDTTDKVASDCCPVFST